MPYESDNIKLLDFTPPGFQALSQRGRVVWARCRVRPNERTLSDVLYEAMVIQRGSAGSVQVYFKCDSTTQTVPSGAYANVFEVGDNRISWKMPEAEDE